MLRAPTLPPARPFGSVLTAMVTPFRKDGSLDLDAAVQLATRLAQAGHDGVVLNGTTGESPTTTDDEKEQLLRAVLEAVGTRLRVVAGVGTNDTRQTVELARAAEQAGAHGLLVVTPYYSKPPQQGLVAHFTAVADATGLPVMLYDIPGRAGVPIAVETLLRLAEHDRIVAVKDAKDDLHAAATAMAETDLAWYSGSDEMNLAHLTQGAAGVVSVIGHVAGEQLAEMVAAVDRGDLARAIAVRAQLIPVINSIMRVTQGAIAVKAALQLLGHLPNRVVRLPLVAGGEDLVATLSTALKEAGLA
ncbi:MAG: 4-hydroxy-tetrahydrodipicolinate synthase [Actinomycetes bacterium]